MWMKETDIPILGIEIGPLGGVPTYPPVPG